MTSFVDQPQASPGSAKYIYVQENLISELMDSGVCKTVPCFAGSAKQS